MKLKEIYGLCRNFVMLCNTFGKELTLYHRPYRNSQHTYGNWEHIFDDWEVVGLYPECYALKIILEDPNKTEGKNDEQENLLHKTETNRLAASVDQYNNADNGQRKCDNNSVSNASGDIPDDNEGKNNISEQTTNTMEETKMTLVDRILEMMYQALVEGAFDEELGNYPLYEYKSGTFSRLKEFYNSDIQVTLPIEKENSTINEKHYISNIITDATGHGQEIGFKNGFLIGMLFGNQTNSKPVIFNQPKENNPNGYNH